MNTYWDFIIKKKIGIDSLANDSIYNNGSFLFIAINPQIFFCLIGYQGLSWLQACAVHQHGHGGGRVPRHSFSGPGEFPKPRARDFASSLFSFIKKNTWNTYCQCQQTFSIKDQIVLYFRGHLVFVITPQHCCCGHRQYRSGRVRPRSSKTLFTKAGSRAGFGSVAGPPILQSWRAMIYGNTNMWGFAKIPIQPRLCFLWYSVFFLMMKMRHDHYKKLQKNKKDKNHNAIGHTAS